jgi:hypothetical protein
MAMVEHEIGARLARIETKVDMLLARDTDHENRLRTVEKRTWYTAGAAMLLAVFAPKLTLPV